MRNPFIRAGQYEYRENRDFDQHLREDDTQQIEALLLGHRVAKISEDHLQLDDGTVLKLFGNDGGCACSAGCYSLVDLNEVDNIITKVELKVSKTNKYDDCLYEIFVVAEDKYIRLAAFEGSDGNGYYGTGYHILVRAPEETA